MFEKVHVKIGPNQHPLYKELTTAQPRATTKPGSSFASKLAGYGQAPKQPNDVLWNFEKFLVGRNGEILGRFAPDIEPDDSVIVASIQKALQATVS